MTRGMLQDLKFIREDQAVEKHSEVLYSLTSNSQIPIPREGEIIEFGWHEKDGERQYEISMEDLHYSEGVEYVASDRYEVKRIESHYHQNHTVDDNHETLTNRIEIETNVIVTEVGE